MDEKTHSYFVDGEVADISVTELLHKHGLAPSYNGVDEGVLEEARARGKEVHRDIECYIEGEGFIPETRAGLNFAHWAELKIKEAHAEQKIAFEYKGIVIAGSIDLIGNFEGLGAVIADHKTTSRFQREYVSWQLSIYDYIARKLNGIVVNNRRIILGGAEKFLCFLFDQNGDMTVKECDKIPDDEIERLFECEANGEIYKRAGLVLSDEMALEIDSAEATLLFYEQAAKTAKARAEKVRAAVLAEMEKQGIFSYESEKVKIAYRAGYTKEAVDGKALKAEMPEVYKRYLKKSAVKPTVVITPKKGEKNAEE